MRYELVYDVMASGYRQWRFPAFGLVFLALGIAQLIYRRFYPATTGWKRTFPYIYTGFALVWSLVAFGATYYEYRHVVGSLKDGRYVLVEGSVAEFVPMPAEGHADESFTVNGRKYRYSDYRVSACFNNTQSHGGPIRDGLRVRIADVNGCIARLEVAR